MMDGQFPRRRVDGQPTALWERRPAWPRPGGRGRVRWADMNPGMRRWLREPEPFERRAEHDPYPGATTLDDLAPETDEATTLRVLARYTTVRLLLLWSAGGLAGPKLHTERRVALEHLALLPSHDWERRALERLAALCRGEPSPEAVAGAALPAECAAKHGHFMGAFALYRAAWELALRREWWRDAADTAAAVARLARMYEAPRSDRLWSWRSRVLLVRAARQAEAERLAAGEPTDSDGGS
jgi:hypothetical protein